MKRFVSTLALLVLCSSNALASMMFPPSHINEFFSITKMVDACDLVVTGTVASMDYVARRGVTDDGGNLLTTDISIAVDQVIKGEPNAGEALVKFMIEGGEGISFRTGEFTRMHSSGQGRFTLDERVLVFLKKGDRNSYARNYPYDRLHLYAADYGERKIKNDHVRFLYVGANNAVKAVKTPLDIAVKLGKAAQEDKAEAEVLDNMIKAAARASTDRSFTLPTTVSDRIKRKAQEIIDKP